MLVFAFAYSVSTFSVFLFLYLKAFHTLPLPHLCLTKGGLSFYSTKRHKLKVGDIKIMQLDNVCYLKSANKTVILKNVTKTQLKKGYVYFTSLGEVKVLFNCKLFYKYFNVDICSPKFDLTPLRLEALNEIANNLFSLNNCKKTKRYIFIISKILNIKLEENKIKIKQNKYFLPFKLTYKAKNIVKEVKIN